MIRFLCPQCDKALRADDSKAGTPVKCPVCGHKVTIPDADAELPPPEGEEPERPPPRKRKRPRFRPKTTEAARGKVLVILICCVVLGMHLVSLIKYLATPDPVEVAKKQAREIYQKIGKDLPKDFEQTWEQELDKVMGAKEMQATLRPGQTHQNLPHLPESGQGGENGWSFPGLSGGRPNPPRISPKHAEAEMRTRDRIPEGSGIIRTSETPEKRPSE